jgi:hypothetical protein
MTCNMILLFVGWNKIVLEEYFQSFGGNGDEMKVPVVCWTDSLRLQLRL